jgi:hypothetical protein
MKRCFFSISRLLFLLFLLLNLFFNCSLLVIIRHLYMYIYLQNYFQGRLMATNTTTLYPIYLGKKKMKKKILLGIYAIDFPVKV